MTRNPAAALRALANHIDLHKLNDDRIIRAAWNDGCIKGLDVQVHATEGDVAGAFGPWVDSMTDAEIAVEPSTTTDNFRLTANGVIGGFPVEVLCIASGAAAEKIRAMAGLPVVPAPLLPSGREVLAALAGTAAAS